MSEHIIAFVGKSADGRRWTDIENEFCSKKGKWAWSKGKFVNHWKEAKEYLTKIKDERTGRHRYYVKEDFKEHAEKVILREDVEEKRLNVVPIPKLQRKRAIDTITKRDAHKYVKSLGFSKRIRWSKENLFFLKKQFERILTDKDNFCNIMLSYPQRTPQPNLDEDDIAYLLDILLTQAIRREDIDVDKLEDQGFKIILSYEPQTVKELVEEKKKADPLQDGRRVLSKRRRLFIDYLKELHGKEIDPKVASFLFLGQVPAKPKPSTLEETKLQIKTLRKKAEQYRRYQRKFWRDYRTFLKKLGLVPNS